MKKSPAHSYHRKTGRVPIIATLAVESRLRVESWLRNGCNGFDMKIPTSNPLSFWTEQDILHYIKENDLEICSVYGNIIVDDEASDNLAGQIDFSELGLIQDTRPLKTTGCTRTGCMFCGYGCHLNNDQRFVIMKETHPKIYDYIMRSRDSGGLGYKEVIDWINNNSDLDIKY